MKAGAQLLPFCFLVDSPTGEGGKAVCSHSHGCLVACTESKPMATIELIEEKISTLKYINKNNLSPGKYEFPDFLLIGPQRTGTTWLYKNLSVHPNIFMTTHKELFFFNKLMTKSGDNYHSDRLEWYSSNFIPTLTEVFKQNASNLKSTTLLRSMSFQLKKCFFGCMKGEATASYAVMDECLIEEIVRLNSQVKAIMLIRNPVDRAWSHAKLVILKLKRKTINEVDMEEFIKIYNRYYHVKCGMYSAIIENWSKYLGIDNLFIGSYDDIKSRPVELLKSILMFLKVPNKDRYINKSLALRVINQSSSEIIPETHKLLLLNLFKSEMEFLKEKYNLEWESM